MSYNHEYWRENKTFSSSRLSHLNEKVTVLLHLPPYSQQ